MVANFVIALAATVFNRFVFSCATAKAYMLSVLKNDYSTRTIWCVGEEDEDLIHSRQFELVQN